MLDSNVLIPRSEIAMTGPTGSALEGRSEE